MPTRDTIGMDVYAATQDRVCPIATDCKGIASRVRCHFDKPWTLTPNFLPPANRQKFTQGCQTSISCGNIIKDRTQAFNHGPTFTAQKVPQFSARLTEENGLGNGIFRASTPSLHPRATTRVTSPRHL